MRECVKNKGRSQVGIGTLIVFIALVLVAAIAAGVLINTAGFLQTQAEETGQDSTDQVADNINVIGEVGEVTNVEGEINTDLSEIDDERFDDDDEAIYEVGFTVQRSPGSGSIDLTGLSIQWVGDNGFAQLIHISEFDQDENPVNIYFVQEITAESDEDAVLTDDSDRYKIVIPVGTEIEFDSDGDAYRIRAASADDLAIEMLFSDDGGDGDYEDASDVYSDDLGTDVEVSFEDDFNSGLEIYNTDFEIMSTGESATITMTTAAGASRTVEITTPDTLIGDKGSTVSL